MITLTNGTTTLTPLLREGWESDNESSNVVHELIDGSIALTLRPDKPRTGTLTLLFGSPEDAENARAALTTPAVWTVSDDYALASLTFARRGSVSVSQQSDRKHWIVKVGYQEVPQ